MKRAIRIVFMGTPDFAVATLDALVTQGYDVVGVITAPDKPAGRGRKLNESAVKTYAKAKGLHLLQPTNLKDEGFLADLKALNANLQIVVAFRMLPKVVWDLPEYGTFNLHASLLPNYRGAAPINWAIINGETETGVSTFFIDDKIDTGAMILQESVAIGAQETAGSLHDKLMAVGSALVVKTVGLIEEDKAEATPQETIEGIKTAYKLNKYNCRIDWTAAPADIYNKIRGLNPYPAAYTMLYNGDDALNVKIYDARFEAAEHDHTIGLVLAGKKELKIAVENGFMYLLDIKLPGKRKMEIVALLNGFDFVEGANVR